MLGGRFACSQTAGVCVPAQQAAEALRGKNRVRARLLHGGFLFAHALVTDKLDLFACLLAVFITTALPRVPISFLE
jgi:hypothetical protein